MENNVLKRQYGIFISFCFVVGFIVGTGIFFLPGRILYEAGGSIWLGVSAWIIGGLMIAPCVYMFSKFAGHYEKVHGFVDYAEVIVGRKYGYLAGWFFAIMYQPAGYAIIAWITSGFILSLIEMDRFLVASFIMAITYFINYFAPKIPIKFNVISTVLRLIPLIVMGIVGLIVTLFGLNNNVAHSNPISGLETNLFAAISATAFAFNGWQAALAFNSEIKDSKKKFPMALMLGYTAVAIVYILYFIGIATIGDSTELANEGGANFAHATHSAFQNIFGEGASNILVVFMIISGLGILNACCLGMGRAMYSLGRRNLGPSPRRMAKLDDVTQLPNNSMTLAFGISFLWLLVIFANIYWLPFNFSLPDFYNFSFFGLIIPIFIFYMIKQSISCKIKSPKAQTKKFIAPVLAILGAGFMFSSYWLGNLTSTLVYVILFIILASIGFIFYRKEELN